MTGPGAKLFLALLLVAAAACGRNEGDPFKDNLLPVSQAGPDLSGATLEVLTFDGSSSTDPDGDIELYEWNFGDGGQAEGAVVTHAYQAGGGFLATLKVTDNVGGTDSDTLQVTITQPVPVATFTLPTDARAGDVITFDGTSSTAPAPILSYEWSFGDAQSASGPTVQHTYQRTGTFGVRLTVTDTQLREGTLRQELVVQPIDIDGVYDIASTPSSRTCGSYSVSFGVNLMTITVTNPDGSVEAVSGTSQLYDGTITGTSLSLSASYIGQTGGGCIPATVTATLNADFDTPGHFTGSAVVFSDAGLNCTCTAQFDVEGTRR